MHVYTAMRGPPPAGGCNPRPVPASEAVGHAQLQHGGEAQFAQRIVERLAHHGSCKPLAAAVLGREPEIRTEAPAAANAAATVADAQIGQRLDAFTGGIGKRRAWATRRRAESERVRRSCLTRPEDSTARTRDDAAGQTYAPGVAEEWSRKIVVA